jgi:hypothetical protein
MTEEAVFMRDSEDAAGPVLRFDRNEWASFIEAVRDDRLM